MSAESEDSGGDMSLGPGSCRNAEQYALMRLDDEGEPMQAKELADEYDCTNGHMRKALNNLRETGAVERVERGIYTHTNADESRLALPDTETSEADDSGDDERPSADGPARSEDTDGAAGDQDGDDEESIEADQEEIEDDEQDADGEEDEAPPLIPVPKTVAFGAVAILLLILAWKVYQEMEQGQQVSQHQEEQRQRQSGASGLLG